MLVTVILGGCLSTPTVDPPPSDAATRPGSTIGGPCDVVDLCAGGFGVCAPSGDGLVCRVQCRAAEYPRCAPGSVETHADLFGLGNEQCYCVPGVA